MTLEEVIKHAEEVAVEMDESAKAWQKDKDRGIWSKSDIENIDSSIIACNKYADEHRQLAEWLRDYKRLKEQEPCEDAVSRQGLLDAFGLSEKTRKYGGDHSGYDTMMLYEIQYVMENAESVNPQEPKWIPVSEKLPEFRKEVLTCSNGGFIGIQSLEDSYDGYWENQKGDWTDLEEITAWMPLPEPFKMSGFPTDCSNLDSCENCKYDDGECCRLLYEAKMESEDKE